jgi:glycosyltransferase involved in cell wall biosynthesis
MIGPDDDGRDLAGQPVTYLGPQPRSVVRGALAECLALVNMSVSESFGIVLLEAWMHGRPVIVNRGCPAFLDLAVHEHNALLVDEASLAPALMRLEADAGLADRLGSQGRAGVPDYSWAKIGSDFVAHCRKLVG